MSKEYREHQFKEYTTRFTKDIMNIYTDVGNLGDSEIEGIFDERLDAFNGLMKQYRNGDFNLQSFQEQVKDALSNEKLNDTKTSGSQGGGVQELFVKIRDFVANLSEQNTHTLFSSGTQKPHHDSLDENPTPNKNI